MLTLTRKVGEAVRLEYIDTTRGPQAMQVTVAEVRGRGVRLAIEAPRGVGISRDDDPKPLRELQLADDFDIANAVLEEIAGRVLPVVNAGSRDAVKLRLNEIRAALLAKLRPGAVQT